MHLPAVIDFDQGKLNLLGAATSLKSTCSASTTFCLRCAEMKSGSTSSAFLSSETCSSLAP